MEVETTASAVSAAELKILELKKDMEELKNLQQTATRQKVKDILDIELRKLSTEILKLEEQNKIQPSVTSRPLSSNSNQRYQIKLNNYAWDQTDKFVKFYISLKNVHTITEENIFCKFTEKSLELNVKNLENKDYYFVINNLLMKIKPEQSTWKVKTDTVIINVCKVEPTQWLHVTALEKKAKDAENKFDDDVKDDDPSAGIINLMKKMYEKGDDEMKRTIAKAWTESQTKIK